LRHTRPIGSTVLKVPGALCTAKAITQITPQT
jgi:hypothetical protein